MKRQAEGKPVVNKRSGSLRSYVVKEVVHCVVMIVATFDSTENIYVQHDKQTMYEELKNCNSRMI